MVLIGKIKKLEWNQIKQYIPFTQEFNKEALKLLYKKDRPLFLIILLIFVVVLMGTWKEISNNMLIVILGGFLLIAFYLYTRK